MVKELEGLERQLRALQEQCERAKREAKEREEGEREGTVVREEREVVGVRSVEDEEEEV